MTAIDIDAIRQREQVADAAPWRVVEEHGRDIADEAYRRLTIQTATPNLQGCEIAEMVDGDNLEPWASKLTEENAEFIANARQDIPALLAEVDRLRAELEIAERDLALSVNDRIAMKAKLDGPCGSCHPCINWADETWQAAGRKPPTVQEWDDVRSKLAAARAQLGGNEQIPPACACCYVDGHTRRCGRDATTINDVPPFGPLDMADECKTRINGGAR